VRLDSSLTATCIGGDSGVAIAVEITGSGERLSRHCAANARPASVDAKVQLGT
jgi:hypothetical protein